VPDYYEPLAGPVLIKVTHNVTLRVLKEHPETVVQIMLGNKKAAGAIVAQVMRHTAAQASPRLINQVIQGYLQALGQRGTKCPRCEGPKQCVRYRFKTVNGEKDHWACEDCKPSGGRRADEPI